LNDVFTKKLKPQLGARWQDKEEGYQNVFAGPDEEVSELGRSKKSKGSRGSRGSRGSKGSKSGGSSKEGKHDRSSPPKAGGTSDTDSDTTPRSEGGGKKIKKSTSQQNLKAHTSKSSLFGLPMSFNSLFGKKSKHEPSLSQSAPPGQFKLEDPEDETTEASRTSRSRSDKRSQSDKGKGKEKEGKGRSNRKSESPRARERRRSSKPSPRSKSEQVPGALGQSSEMDKSEEKKQITITNSNKGSPEKELAASGKGKEKEMGSEKEKPKTSARVVDLRDSEQPRTPTGKPGFELPEKENDKDNTIEDSAQSSARGTKESSSKKARQVQL
jgi:hypothetical protein